MKIIDALYCRLLNLVNGTSVAPRPPRIKTVSYGRSIECGQFGRGRTGKVWFGWETEVGADETEDEAMARLRTKADALEKPERDAFSKRDSRVRAD